MMVWCFLAARCSTSFTSHSLSLSVCCWAESANTNGECDSVLPWEIPSSGVLLKMENAVRGLFSWVETRWLRQPWLMVYAVLILINLSDQSRPTFSLSVLQSGLKSFATRWRMIIQYYAVFIHVHFALWRTSALPGKSDLTGLMLFESFSCTSDSLFWQLSTFSNFSSVFFLQTLWVQRQVSRSCKMSSWEEKDLKIYYNY